MKTDPVCGMEVHETEAPAKTQYNGITYYFCSRGCLGAFEDNPKQWVFEAAVSEAA